MMSFHKSNGACTVPHAPDSTTEAKRSQEGEDWASDRKAAKSEAHERVRKLSRAPMATGELPLKRELVTYCRTGTAFFTIRSGAVPQWSSEPVSPLFSGDNQVLPTGSTRKCYLLTTSSCSPMGRVSKRKLRVQVFTSLFSNLRAPEIFCTHFLHY